MRRLIALSILLIGILSLRAQPDAAIGNIVSPIRVSLAICSPGKELYSVVGHAALRIEDERWKSDETYSYEAIITSSLKWDYLLGRLQSQWRVRETESFVRSYQEEGRTVTFYPINLPASSLRKLEDRLKEAVTCKPENYDCIERGCAIQILHLIEEVISPTQIEYACWPERYTKSRRAIIGEGILREGNWWDYALLNIILPHSIDKPCRTEDKLCIPADLLEAWQSATYQSTNLPINLLGVD